nr:MAG TPA: hypothetical protein [Caudoviricetes sp.]
MTATQSRPVGSCGASLQWGKFTEEIPELPHSQTWRLVFDYSAVLR